MLGDVADVVAGVGFPKDMQGGQDGAIPVFKVGDISAAWLQGKSLLADSRNYLSAEEAKSLGKCVPAGATVFAKIGEALRLNRRVMLGRDALVDNNVMGLVPKREKVSPKYLYYFMQTVDLGELSRSTTVPSIRKSDVVEISIPVPRLAAQDQIVAELEKQFSRLDEAVANLQRVKANLKRYKASVLKAAVEGRLVETEATLAHREGRTYETGEQLLQRILEERRAKWTGKRKYREPVKPETEALSELPTGWVWASPEQVSAGEPYSLAIGPFGSSLKVSDYKTEGVPLVFVRNIRSGSFGGENTVYVTADKAAELSAHSVDAGDVLVTKMGDPPGDVCRYPANRPPAVITADCIKLRVTKVGVDPGFIEYAIASRVVQDQILGITKGVAQLKVNLANFSSIALPLPPYAEQARIVVEVDSHLSIIREVEAEVDANLQRAQALRQSVLQRDFSTASPNADALQPTH
nr:MULTISPECIES: restriction endonuclease subunit S [Acidovorax]